MRLSWKRIRLLIWIANSLFILCVLVLSQIAFNWFASVENTSNQSIASKLSSGKPKRPFTANENQVSDDELSRAAKVNLQRMNPPKPPVPPPPIVTVVPAIQVPALLFPGTLVGTFEDADPQKSYAVLRWPDQRIQLVTVGEALSPAGNSPKIDSVLDRRVVIRLEHQTQTLEMK